MSKVTGFLFLIILSVIVVFFTKEVGVVLHWIADAHHFLLAKLALFITNPLIRLTLALIVVPLVLALIPAFIYWLFKRRMLPDYFAFVWVIWFALVTIVAYR